MTDTIDEADAAAAARAQVQTKLVHRLRRARGQLDAVIRAVEGGGSCRDVVTQLAAVTHALNRAGFLVVSTAMQQCVADEAAAEASGASDADAPALTTAELEKIFLTLA